MLIIEQGRDSITNLDHFGTIETDGADIVAYPWNGSDEKNVLANYSSEERAKEVFAELIEALCPFDELVFTKESIIYALPEK